MNRFYFLLLFLLIISPYSFGQVDFFDQHEKFLEQKRLVDTLELKKILLREEQIAKKEEKNINYRLKTTLEFDRGVYYYMADQYEKSVLHFEKALELGVFHSIRDEILLYTYLGDSYRRVLADYNRAHTCFDHAILKANAIDNRDLIAESILMKADVYFHQGNTQPCIQILNVLTTSKFSELSIKTKILIHSALIEVHEYVGNQTQAYINSNAALELAIESNDEILIADQQHNLAVVLVNQEAYEKACLNIKKAIKTYEKWPEMKQDIQYSYIVFSVALRGKGELDSAYFYLKKTLDFSISIDDQEVMESSYIGLGAIYSDKMEYNTALNYLKKAAELGEQAEGKWVTDLGLIYHDIGVCLLFLERYSEAIVYLNKSNDSSIERGDIGIIFDNYIDLSEAYKEDKQLGFALQMKDSALRYYDSLLTIAEVDELHKLETQYETRLKDQENLILKGELRKGELEREKEKKEARDWIILSFLIILVLIGAIYVLLVRNRLKKSKIAETQSQIRNQKLETELLIEKISKFNDHISSQDEEIQLLEENIYKTKSATDKTLLSKVTLENDWLTFMVAFDKTYDNYLIDLKENYSNLTAYNLRLAAMVKLELSNKEIAVVFNISENGVKKAKQRLKEKIGD